MKNERSEISKKGVVRLVMGIAPFYATLKILLTIIGGLSSTGLLAWAVANFVDKALIILSTTGQKREVILPLVILLIVFGIFETVESVEKMVDVKIRLKVMEELNPDLVKTQASFEYKYIENDKDWERISRIMREPANALTDGFGAYILVIRVVISVGSVLGLLMTSVWWSAIVILAFSVPMFILSLVAGKKNYQAAQEAEKYNRRTDYLDSVLTGRDNIEERTMFRFGSALGDTWQEQYETGRKLQLKVSLRQFITMKASSLILAMISLLIAMTLISPVISGQLSIGLFTGIVSSIFGIINQLSGQLSSAMERISRSNAYMKEMRLFEEMDSTPNALVEPSKQPPKFECLEFRNVVFSYPSNCKEVLKGLSFKMERGKHYAIVGKNGAGKSTFTKLLTGLYSDYMGEILINGKELRTYSLDEIKAIFSVVYQDFAKYSVSLRDNIAIGNVTKKNEQDVEAIVKRTGIVDIVEGLENGMDTKLGKIDGDGQDISGGQWQRVAIARALFSGAEVRILDEPTAALDPIRETEIYMEFEKLMKEKTTIFISHRLGSTKLADEIIVIDDGCVIEKGTHEELMNIKGQYAQMYESQRSWYTT